jgi:hypothetical protein
VDAYYRFTGANDEFLQRGMEFSQQYLLPRSWTLDIVFAPEDVAGNAINQIFSWTSTSGQNDIIVNWYTQSAGTPYIVEMIVKTSGGTYTLKSTTQVVPAGSGAAGQAHLRLVRLFGNLGFWVNGILQETLDIPNDRHVATDGTWRIGDVSGTPRYTGLIHRVILRQGAVLSGVEGYSDYMFPMNDDVRLYVYGGRQVRNSVGGVPSYFTRDYSRFGSYSIIAGTPDIVQATSDPPTRQAVQLMTTFTDGAARRWNVYMVGGTLFWEPA